VADLLGNGTPTEALALPRLLGAAKLTCDVALADSGAWLDRPRGPRSALSISFLHPVFIYLFHFILLSGLFLFPYFSRAFAVPPFALSLSHLPLIHLVAGVVFCVFFRFRFFFLVIFSSRLGLRPILAQSSGSFSSLQFFSRAVFIFLFSVASCVRWLQGGLLSRAGNFCALPDMMLSFFRSLFPFCSVFFWFFFPLLLHASSSAFRLHHRVPPSLARGPFFLSWHFFRPHGLGRDFPSGIAFRTLGLEGRLCPMLRAGGR
jgi:hypothetical protein